MTPAMRPNCIRSAFALNVALVTVLRLALGSWRAVGVAYAALIVAGAVGLLLAMRNAPEREDWG